MNISRHASVLALSALIAPLALTAPAAAAPPEPDDAAAGPPDPEAPASADPAPSVGAGTDEEPAEGAEAGPEEPGQGDFDAGGQVRLPNGPDEMGQYAAFNWVAVDLVGRYFLLDFLTVNAFAPVAVIKPDVLPSGQEPSIFGGIDVSLEAALPQMPFQVYETDVALVLSGAFMREGAMLLSDKDFPLFDGDFKPGFTTGLDARVKLSSLLDFAAEPVFVYQSGTAEALTAVQIPTSLVVKLGELVKVSADAGVFTGDDFSFSGEGDGRIAVGGSLAVKIGPVLAHAGAGVASLLTGGAYPTIGDSVYVDLNVKYAK